MFIEFKKVHSIKFIKLLKKLKLEQYQIKIEIKENINDTICLSVFKNNNFYFSEEYSCYFKKIYLSKLTVNIKKEIISLADKIIIN